MQDRSRQLDENLLQRTAGPYIWVNRDSLAIVRATSALPLIADVRGEDQQVRERCQQATLHAWFDMKEAAN